MAINGTTSAFRLLIIIYFLVLGTQQKKVDDDDYLDDYAKWTTVPGATVDSS